MLFTQPSRLGDRLEEELRDVGICLQNIPGSLEATATLKKKKHS